MSIYTIYKITNTVNSKVYIGQTVTTPAERMSGHRSDAVRRSKNVLHNAMRKHGFDKFNMEVIFNVFDVEHLGELEQFFIKEYDCCIADGKENGYNTSRGGNAPMFGRIHSEESKLKMSESRKGKLKSEEHKLKISEGNKGKVFSEETLSRMSAAQKARAPKTEEHRRKSSEAMKGKKFTESHRLNLGAINKLRHSKKVQIGDNVYDTVQNAADSCGVSRNTIANWKKTGKAIYIDGN